MNQSRSAGLLMFSLGGSVCLVWVDPVGGIHQAHTYLCSVIDTHSIPFFGCGNTVLPRYFMKWVGTLVLSGDGVLLMCSRLGCWSIVACVYVCSILWQSLMTSLALLDRLTTGVLAIICRDYYCPV